MNYLSFISNYAMGIQAISNQFKAAVRPKTWLIITKEIKQ